MTISPPPQTWPKSGIQAPFGYPWDMPGSPGSMLGYPWEISGDLWETSWIPGTPLGTPWIYPIISPGTSDHILADPISSVRPQIMSVLRSCPFLMTTRPVMTA